MIRPRLDVIEQRNFARTQFLWLRQVAFDLTLPALASRVAIALTGYFNRDSQLAYPAHSRLAAELGVTDRAIRATISQLIDHGHLGVVGDRHGGRRRTNRYRLIIQTPKGGTPVPGFIQERRNNRAAKAENFCTKGGTQLPPNLSTEPKDEPSSGTDLVKMDAKTWLSKTIRPTVSVMAGIRVRSFQACAG